MYKQLAGKLKMLRKLRTPKEFLGFSMARVQGSLVCNVYLAPTKSKVYGAIKKKRKI
jgi:hypothetical protein